jgi:sugar phosphate isomerase/epimerase
MDTVVGGATDAERFERARRAGFAGVELVVSRDDLRGGRRLDDLPRALPVPTLVLGDHNHGGGIADADADVARAAEQDVRDAVDRAAALGADVVLVPFFLRGEITDEAGFDRCADAFRGLCPVAAERGVTLAFEGTLPAERIRALAAHVESRAFGCYFDCANVTNEGLDASTEVLALGELVTRVHVKDTRSRRGDVVPGLGRVDFASVAKALTAIGYDGWIVVESPAAPWELIARDLSFARRHFPALEPPLRWPEFGTFSYDFAAGEWNRLLEAVTALGLDTVQLGGELLVEALADPGARPPDLRVAALAGYRNLIAPDAKERRENLRFIARCLEAAPALGTSVVATEAGTRNPDSEWDDHPDNRREDAWELFLDAVDTLLPLAERYGSILALEASVKHVLRTEGRVLEVLDRFPSRHLQLVCDPYNYVSRAALPGHERTSRALLDRLEHRFVLAHLKDVGAGGAEESTPEFGTGVFDQRPYLEFLRTKRPDLPLILEHLPLDHIPRAIERVRGLVTPPPRA